MSDKDHSFRMVPRRALYTEEARRERLEFLRRQTSLPLASFEETRLESSRLRGRVESFLGGIEIPVGVAGPLLFRSTPRGETPPEHIYAPIATTEGALIASVNRGARALSLSGGVYAHVIRQRMTRVPLFEFADIRAAVRFCEWVGQRLDVLRQRVRLYSNHAKLCEVEPDLFGKTVHLRFAYETGDAAGQNMTTICTWNLCRWICDETAGTSLAPLELVVEGNLSGDKKICLASVLRGRGTRVSAECTVRRDVLRRVLKTTPEDICRFFARSRAGASHAGFVGFNINVSNAVAGIFTATGQDIACVHESSVAELHVEVVGEDLYASMTLPNLVVGTVGGGTSLPAQRELLELMGCYGVGRAGRLARVIAGYALALDVSTMSAIVGGQFAAAHERLGRNPDLRPLVKAEIDDAFFARALARVTGCDVQVRRVEPIEDFVPEEALLLDISSQVTKRICGLWPYQVEWTASEGSERKTTRLLIKAKALDTEVLLATEMMATLSGGRVAQAYRKFAPVSPFRGCHLRELEVYRLTDPRFTEIAPKVYDTVQDDGREIYLVVLEYLEGLELMNSVDDVSGWTPEHLLAALEGIAGFHSLWYGREDLLLSLDWAGFRQSAASMAAAAEFWSALADFARGEFPHWFTEEDLERHRRLIASLPAWWGEIDQMEKTLIHNDFNPRNLAFRRPPEGGGRLRLCAYDWELATCHLPQHDAVEVLSFVLGPAPDADLVARLLTRHREALEEQAGVAIDPAEWRRGYQLCLYDYQLHKLPLYIVAHAHRPCGFVERVYATLRGLIALEEASGG